MRTGISYGTSLSSLLRRGSEPIGDGRIVTRLWIDAEPGPAGPASPTDRRLTGIAPPLTILRAHQDALTPARPAPAARPAPTPASAPQHDVRSRRSRHPALT